MLLADLRAHANTASAVRKAQSSMDERRERSTCVSGFPMKATSATRAVAWCSDGMLDDPQKSDSTKYSCWILRRSVGTPHLEVEILKFAKSNFFWVYAQEQDVIGIYPRSTDA